MKAQFYAVVVALVCVGGVMTQKPQENDLDALLKKLNLTDPQTQIEFLAFVDPRTLQATINCLIEGGGGNCDPRTSTVRAVLQELSARDYQCSTCDVATQRVLNIMLRSIRQSANPQQCKSLEEGLQLAAPFCS